MEDAPTSTPLVSVGEAADIAGKRESVADHLAAAGTLPGLVRLPGSRMLVGRRVLEAWLGGEGEDVAALPTDGRNV